MATRARTGPSATGEEEGEGREGRNHFLEREGMRTLSFLEVTRILLLPGFALDGNRTHNHPVKGGSGTHQAIAPGRCVCA